ncbi:lysylphosphatidylglycerol synthase transmembrane domain-containing protein [Sulfitobacter guttiformis]|uniref:Uncharacterized membrane protein YbhN (UPF0104 family) n=1 Tax=Sulfitobacter guttiformis TaxID=74349 RepID=A0A420DTC1_9RHOB|nr:lysylphosphatidylglycerol synthase transmembrane domain-containing protein [Sulfitobacter guttiformis]KIN71089.1 putative membrane protein [Sulfitobacter guttiformis KCTC 32187]RKE97571.1 uncharacterized membrane protein YbhN (UPF0104 family) [Sulfitobacter guttiformis]
MTRAILWRGGQIGVLVGLALLLWHAADGRTALEQMRHVDPRWLVAAAILLSVQTILSAQRWRLTAAQLGLAIPVFSALKEYYLAQIVNQSLPGGVLGDAGRALRSRGQAGLAVAAQAVVFERVAGQLGLLAVLTCGACAGLLMPTGLNWPDWVGQAVFVGGIAAAFFAASGALAPIVRRAARQFADAVWAPRVRLQQIVLSVTAALCNVAAFACCAFALGVAMPAVAVAVLVPLILFAMVLPLSVAGWGLREGAAALLFPVMGATAASGLATSIAFGSVFLLTTLPGLLVPLLLTSTAHSKGENNAP